MSQNPVTLAPITSYIAQRLSAGWRSLRRSRQQPVPAGTASDVEPDLPFSKFADTEFPGYITYDEDVDPLVEAEIYVIFGRNHDALAVLEEALDSGRLTDEQVSRFWAEREAAEAGRVRR